MIRRAQRPARTARNRRQESRVIPCLECLEDRTLLSGAPSLVPGAYDPTQVLVQFQPAAVAKGARSSMSFPARRSARSFRASLVCTTCS